MNKLRARALEYSKVTPWQKVADSPVTKYYTDWRGFEEVLDRPGQVSYERPRGEWDLVLGPCGSDYNYDIDETLLDLRASRLYSEHVARLEGAHLVDAKGRLRVALCRPTGEAWASQHLVINVPERAEADVIIYAPRGAPGSTGVEVKVKEGARASVLIVAEPDPRWPTAYLIRRAVGVRASLSSLVVASPSAVERVDEQTVMAAQSRLTHASLTFSWGTAKVDNIIDTVQGGRDSSADVYGLGVASGPSLVSVRGTAILTPQAVSSSSRFIVEALLLDEQARAYTMPMMRIETGDVNVASHRAAQYRLPGDQLFYLESRGLSPGEAMELLLRGRVDHMIGLSGVPGEAAETARSLAYALVKSSLAGGLTPPRLEALAPS